ncbi:MAG: hypothetical protein AAF690_21380 [Acidobacteriota bacterium]
MINVTLNVVGLYYGQTFEVVDNPTVLDVLNAASGEDTGSGILSFAMNSSNPNSIDWVENDLSKVKIPRSRKARPGGKPRKLKNRVLRLQEGVFNQPASNGSLSLISVAWQYYIEKARTKNPPLVTTTFSIDNVIVDAGVSNNATEGKKIEDGDTVTLRLLCINSSLHPVNEAPDGLPPRKQ